VDLSVAAHAAEHEGGTDKRRYIPVPIQVAYGSMTIVVVLGVAAVIWRPALLQSTAFAGWGVTVFELVGSVLCLAAAAYERRFRLIAIILGSALLAWTLGDLVVTLESIGGGSGAPLSLADPFYLLFYPLAYVAVVLLAQRELGHMATPNWLDGAVAGCGAGAMCAAFVFIRIVPVEGSRIGTLVNLIYPVGDVLLLALVVGCTALLPGPKDRAWILVAVACAVNAAGDTANLFPGGQAGTGAAGTIDAIAWPVAILLLSLAVWQRPRRVELTGPPRTAGFTLPGLAALGGLGILITATQRAVGTVTIILATGTLVLVGIRLALSVHGLRKVTIERISQSITDELTGLGNRRHLFDILDAYFEGRANGSPVPDTLAFIYLDLDRFKEVNDSFGHSAGDELLRQLGPRLVQSLRDTDVLVRLGGDEFAIVLLGADAAYATSVAERVATGLEERFALEMVSSSIGASMGIALAPQDASSSHELLRCADVAMYRAKVAGSTFAVYDRDIDDGGNLLRLAEELREAVAEGAFELLFQPQLDLYVGTVCSCEALLRWPHPRLGTVPPLKFLPIAEEAGLMAPITAWVLDRALAQCAAWRAAGRTSVVSVNISPSNLLDDGFVDLVAELLDRHRLAPEALVLEITETCIISDYSRSRAVLGQLAATGVVMSVDDFGAGFTSLAYLSDLPVGELKLDREFITGLGTRRRERELVRATIDLGHALGLRVVAEGVEDRESLDLLATLGCDVAQGYFISRPVPAEELDFDIGASIDSAGERRQLVHPGS
jgi:diguanylate cyclase (GGDEF)-like protein